MIQNNKIDNFKARQKAEAIERMKLMGLLPDAIQQFKTHNIINRTERFGLLYRLDDDELALVRECEDKLNAVVYHVIKSLTPQGYILSILFVSAHECEWEQDKAYIKADSQFACIKKPDDKTYTAFGRIGFQESIGGIIRTY